MRVAVLTSTSLRHTYFLQTMRKSFDVRFAAHQPKSGGYYVEDNRSPAVKEHFRRLDAAEKAEFGPITQIEPIESVAEINDQMVVDSVTQADVDYILLFGTAILKPMWLEAFPDRIVNLHLGLSPYYRGAATLFWPAANGEIECMGATIHIAVQKVDAGPIICRIKSNPRVGDDYYALSTRLIRESIDIFPEAVRDFHAGALPLTMQASIGKAYRKNDFNDAALEKALAFFADGLTAEQIEAALKSKKCDCSQ